MSLVNSIQNALPPIHREGYPFIAGFAVITIVLGFVWDPLFYLGLLLTGWCALFFRDPKRVTPVSNDLVHIDFVEVECLKSIALHGWPGNLRCPCPPGPDGHNRNQGRWLLARSR